MNLPAAFILRDASAAPFAEVPLALSGFPKEEAGEVCHYLRKEIVPIGDSRKHPDDGYVIHVEPKQVDGWLSAFALMSERGHEVPAPPDHKDRKNSYGKWVSLSREPNKRGGQSLYGVLRVIGDKNKQDVLNKNVSVCTRRNFKDDRENVYDEAIEHISVTPYPALTGTEGWTSIAASRGAPEEVPVFEMAAARTEEIVMDLSALRKALGGTQSEALSDADVLTKAVERISGIPGAIDAATKPLTDQVAALSRERDDAKLELSRSAKDKPAPPTSSELFWAKKAVETARAEAMQSGLSPATCDKIESRFVGTDTKVFTLSRGTTADDRRALDGMALALDVYEAVKGNVPPPATGEDKAFALSRQQHGEGQADAAKEIADAQKEAAAYQKAQLEARGMTAA